MINPEIRQRLKCSAANFHLPRYAEIPNVGLYLEQVTQYINGYLEKVDCAEITISMVSNYVKKGVIPPPQKKQYHVDQIIYLIFISIVKNVLPLESIVKLFDMQRELYSLPIAYDYFCCELENMLAYVFGLKEAPEENLGVTSKTEEKELLRSVIVSATHSLYISAYFAEFKKEQCG